MTGDYGRLVRELEGVLSYDANVRRASEDFVEAESQKESFFVECIQLLKSNDVEEPTRLCCAIVMKNSLAKVWRLNVLSLESTQRIKNEVIHLLISKQPKLIQNVLETIITSIVIRDYPMRWPGLPDDILQLFSSNDDLQVHQGVSLMKAAMQSADLVNETSNEINAFNEGIVKRCVPEATRQVKKILDTPGWASSDLPASTVKDYLRIFYDALTSYRNYHEEMLLLGDDFLGVSYAVLTTRVPPEVRPSDSDGDNLPVYKAKRRAIAIVGKAGFRSLLTEGVRNNFSKSFVNNYANQFADVCYDIVARHYRGEEYASPRMLILSVTFFTSLLERSSTYLHLKPRMDDILFSFCFPHLCYDETDVSMWNECPMEYASDFSRFCDIRQAASDFISSFARYRGKSGFWSKIGTFIGDTLNRLSQKSEWTVDDYRQKFGIFKLMEAISSRLKEKSRKLKNRSFDITQFIVNTVLPELRSPNPMLRFQSLITLGHFVDPANKLCGYQDIVDYLPQTFTHIIESTRDAEIPVRIQAAKTIGILFKLPRTPATDAVVAPVATGVMRLLFELIRETQNEAALVTSLLNLLRAYDELMTSAGEAIVQLAGVCASRIRKEAHADSLDEFSHLLYSVFSTIAEVMDSAHDCQVFGRLYVESQAALKALLKTAFSPEGVDHLPHTARIYGRMVRYTPEFDAELWTYFPTIYGLVVGYDSDGALSSENIGSFYNPIFGLIERDPEGFLEGRIESMTYKTMVINMAYKGVEDTEAAYTGSYIKSLQILTVLFKSLKASQGLNDVLGSALDIVRIMMREEFALAAQIPQESIEQFKRLECKRALQACLGGFFIYHPLLTVRELNVRLLQDEALQLFFDSNLITSSTKHVMVAAYAAFLKISQHPPIAERVPNCVQSLVCAFGVKYVHRDHTTSGEDEGSGDSEEELSDKDDAGMGQSRTLRALLKAHEEEDDEEDADYVESEPETPIESPASAEGDIMISMDAFTTTYPILEQHMTQQALQQLRARISHPS